MADVIRYAAMARARFSTHGFGRDRWMFAGWAAGGLIVWGAIGMTAAQGFGTFNLDTWLADMRWPMITGLGVAALASLANYRRLLQPA